MNFGPPRLEIHEPRPSTSRSPRVRAHFASRRVHLHGTHWLVAATEAWKLSLAGGLAVRRTSSARQQDIAVARLRGEKLRAIVIDSRTGSTSFQFDLGARLDVRPPRGWVAGQDYELWSLHAPRHRFVAVNAGGLYRTGSTRKAEDRLQPLGTATGQDDRIIIGRITTPAGQHGRSP